MNIEVDIEQIKSSLKELETERDDIQLLCIKSELELSIENVLSELETYKKIAKRLAKEILSIHHPMFNMVTVNNMEILIESARKEVENEQKQ